MLAEHDVEFIVVGGQAETLMGSARVTYDVDLCYRRTPDNLERLAAALGSLSLTLRLGYLEPIGTYEDLLPHAETLDIAGRPTRVIGLDDLIRIKRYLGRPKDRESLLQLEAIKRLREQEGLG